jgi:APA family basic amino acid/polyamine antiporter
MPLVPVAPVLFVLASVAIVVNHLVSDPHESAIGLSLVLSGLPVYWLWMRPRRRPGPMPQPS